ncbi:hypothetical protein BCR42DRAFT_429216 [Absidia repens]|uniref:Uncharacterized protein n=1 Tax=Absidia repens TaxID=90262 RepID=A0A1X2HX21_9FUNG|nr:hypothetical protein BCR42DRAFT_429216 [Absidia repens]
MVTTFLFCDPFVKKHLNKMEKKDRLSEGNVSDDDNVCVCVCFLTSGSLISSIFFAVLLL